MQGQDAQNSQSGRPDAAGNVYKASGNRAARPAPYAGAHQSEKTKEKQRRKKRRHRIALVISLALVVALVGGLYALYNSIKIEIRGEATMDGSVPEEVKTEDIPEYTGKGIICGLICGIDFNDEDAMGYVDEDDKVGRTDLIMYLMYDTVNGKANILQIPRDLFVGNDLQTGGSGKINSLYFNSGDPDNRMAPLLRAVKDQLDLPVDFYVTINMEAVREIVSIKGKITVYVPHDIVAKDTGNVLHQGWQDLSPDHCEFLLRNRNYADADLSRMQTQQSFYSALFREFKQLSPTDLMMWMRVLLYRCNVGGIGPMEIGGLAQKALNLNGADLTFVRPPVTGGSNNGHDVVCLVPDETAELLNEYFRPEGGSRTAEQLNMQTLPPLEHIGKAEASIRTMAGIQETEPELEDEA